MENNLEQRIQDILAKGIKINIDTFISEGWKIFKKVTVFVFLSIIVLGVPAVIIGFILLPFMFDVYSIKGLLRAIEHDPSYFNKLQRSPVYWFKSNLISVFASLAFGPIYGGLLKLCRDVDKDGETSFGALFYYYKKDFYFKLVIVQFVTSTIISIFGFLFGLLGPVGGLLNYISMFATYTLLIFVTPLIVFERASLQVAFSSSFKLVFSAFGSIIAIQLIFIVFAMLGFVACIVGFFFSMAFLPVAQYLLYKYSVGFPEDEIEKAEAGHWQDQPPVS